MADYLPTSVHVQITFIVDLVLQLAPRTVLDVGAGDGKYGLLCREYLTAAGKHAPGQIKIDAVEAFEKYLTPVHQSVYDRVFVGDIRELAARLENYDLVLMIDVFEHLSKAEGKTLMNELAGKARSVLISVPAQEHYQTEIAGNAYQTHHAQYTSWRELRTLGFQQIWRSGGNWIALKSDFQLSLRSRVLRSAVGILLPLDLGQGLARLMARLKRK